MVCTTSRRFLTSRRFTTWFTRRFTSRWFTTERQWLKRWRVRLKQIAMISSQLKDTALSSGRSSVCNTQRTKQAAWFVFLRLCCFLNALPKLPPAFVLSISAIDQWKRYLYDGFVPTANVWWLRFCCISILHFTILLCCAAVLLFVAVVAVVADVAIIFNADHWWRARTGVRGTGLRGATPRRSPPGYRLELSRMSQSKSCTYRFSSSLLKINPCVKHNSHARILLAHLSCHTKNWNDVFLILVPEFCQFVSS